MVENSHCYLYVITRTNTTRKEREDKKVLELDAGDKNSKDYKIETIWDSVVYAEELESGQLWSLYHLVALKGYPEEENI